MRKRPQDLLVVPRTENGGGLRQIASRGGLCGSQEAQAEEERLASRFHVGVPAHPDLSEYGLDSIEARIVSDLGGDFNGVMEWPERQSPIPKPMRNTQGSS
jgi:hypothetical protein